MNAGLASKEGNKVPVVWAVSLCAQNSSWQKRALIGTLHDDDQGHGRRTGKGASNIQGVLPATGGVSLAAAVSLLQERFMVQLDMLMPGPWPATAACFGYSSAYAALADDGSWPNLASTTVSNIPILPATSSALPLRAPRTSLLLTVISQTTFPERSSQLASCSRAPPRTQHDTCTNPHTPGNEVGARRA